MCDPFETKQLFGTAFTVLGQWLRELTAISLLVEVVHIGNDVADKNGREIIFTDYTTHSGLLSACSKMLPSSMVFPIETVNLKMYLKIELELEQAKLMKSRPLLCNKLCVLYNVTTSMNLLRALHAVLKDGVSHPRFCNVDPTSSEARSFFLGRRVLCLIRRRELATIRSRIRGYSPWTWRFCRVFYYWTISFVFFIRPCLLLLPLLPCPR